MAIRFAAWICGTILVCSFSFSAAYADDVSDCNNASGSAKVAACTRLLNSGQYTGKNLGTVYAHRCSAQVDIKAYQAAIDDCSQALRISPADSEYFNRAIAYQGLKKTDEAIADYTRVIGINPRDADAFYNRGELYFTQQKYDDAIKDFSAGIQLNPRDLTNHLVYRGLSFQRKKEYERAIADYSAAIARPDASYVPFSNRLSAHYQSNKTAEAANDLLLLAQRHPDQTARVLRVAPYSVVIRLVREIAKTKQHQSVIDIVSALAKAEAKDREEVEWKQYREAFYLLQLDALATLNRHAEAGTVVDRIERYTSLLQLLAQKKYAALWDKPEVALSLKLSASPLNTLIAAQKTVASSPKSIEAQYELQRAFHLNGKHAEASELGLQTLKNIDKFEGKPADFAWFRDFLADNLTAQGRFDEAEQVMKPLFSGNAKEQNYLVSQFINFGSAYVLQGRFEEAVEWLQKAKGLGSSYGNLWSNAYLACAYHKLGKTSEAAAIVEEVSKDPKPNYFAAFRLHLCLDQYEKAAAVAVEMLKDEEGQATALLMFQDCRENPKRPALARERRAATMKVRDMPAVRAALDEVGRIINEPAACGDRYGT